MLRCRYRYLLLLMILLPCDISSSYVLVSTSVLSFSSRYSISSTVYINLFMNISLVCRRPNHIQLLLLFWLICLLNCTAWVVLFTLDKCFAFIEIILSSKTSLCIRSMTCIIDFWSLSICCTSSWPPAIRLSTLNVEFIKIVEHQVHIFLLFSLEMVYDSLILVNFNSYVGISLPRNSPWLYKIALLIVVIISLSCRNFHMRSIIERFPISSSHGLIIELSALFLEMVIADIESISAEAVVSHPHTVVVKLCLLLVLVDETKVIVVGTSRSIALFLTKHWWLIAWLLLFLNVLPTVEAAISESMHISKPVWFVNISIVAICWIIGVDILWIRNVLILLMHVLDAHLYVFGIRTGLSVLSSICHLFVVRLMRIDFTWHSSKSAVLIDLFMPTLQRAWSLITSPLIFMLRPVKITRGHCKLFDVITLNLIVIFLVLYLLSFMGWARVIIICLSWLMCSILLGTTETIIGAWVLQWGLGRNYYLWVLWKNVESSAVFILFLHLLLDFSIILHHRFFLDNSFVLVLVEAVSLGSSCISH